MVQDPRVNRQLARLGGVYRDPARVNRDASTLLKSSVGQHLQPIAAVHTDDRGHTDTVLVLQGTIAIHFRGNTYQLLMDIYLISGYPIRPPVAYVRLAPNMYLKENHKHVGSDGKVYLPYLHEWHADTHNLVELTVAMSSVFSADPPVFSRPPAAAPAPASPTRHSPPPFAAALNTSATANNPAFAWNPFASSTSTRTNNAAASSSINTSATTTTTTTANSNNWRTQQEELERALAASAAEAAALEAEQRRREADELARAQRESAAAAYAEAQRRQLRDALHAKLQAHFRQLALATTRRVQEDGRDQQALERGGAQLTEQVERYTGTKLELERRGAATDRAIGEIEAWLADASVDAANGRHSSNNNTTTKSIDEICVPSTRLAAQQLELAAETAAIDDALYFLDRALYTEKLEATQHLKQVRHLAKRQFLVKAHLLKIQQHCLVTMRK